MIENGNIWNAFKKVKANEDAPGVDGITVYELEACMRKLYQPLKKELIDGTYMLQSVKRVAIPKPDRTKRYLGIPCVLDRVVQQAMLQVLNRLNRRIHELYVQWCER